MFRNSTKYYWVLLAEADRVAKMHHLITYYKTDIEIRKIKNSSCKYCYS